MTTAIIGTGSIGGRVARLLASGGESVVLVNRDQQKARVLADEIGPAAAVAPVREAVSAAESVVVSVPYPAFAQVIDEVADLLPGRLVVDPTNPVAWTAQGRLERVLPDEESAGEQLVGLLPEGAHFAKAFGTLPAAQLTAGAHRAPESVLFYAADDTVSATSVERLITTAGFAPVRAGTVAEASGRIEMGGDLFGGFDDQPLDVVAARARL
jgi:8-hydroxy-5-deazaflavin:NADPH oxidoreductase